MRAYFFCKKHNTFSPSFLPTLLLRMQAKSLFLAGGALLYSLVSEWQPIHEPEEHELLDEHAEVTS